MDSHVQFHWEVFHHVAHDELDHEIPERTRHGSRPRFLVHRLFAVTHGLKWKRHWKKTVVTNFGVTLPVDTKAKRILSENFGWLLRVICNGWKLAILLSCGDGNLTKAVQRQWPQNVTQKVTNEIMNVGQWNLPFCGVGLGSSCWRHASESWRTDPAKNIFALVTLLSQTRNKFVRKKFKQSTTRTTEEFLCARTSTIHVSIIMQSLALLNLASSENKNRKRDEQAIFTGVEFQTRKEILLQTSTIWDVLRETDNDTTARTFDVLHNDRAVLEKCHQKICGLTGRLRHCSHAYFSTCGNTHYNFQETFCLCAWREQKNMPERRQGGKILWHRNPKHVCVNFGGSSEFLLRNACFACFMGVNGEKWLELLDCSKSTTHHQGPVSPSALLVKLAGSSGWKLCVTVTEHENHWQHSRWNVLWSTNQNFFPLTCDGRNFLNSSWVMGSASMTTHLLFRTFFSPQSKIEAESHESLNAPRPISNNRKKSASKDGCNS